MAQTSAGLADLTILTAEDPRTELLAAILAEMADGADPRGGSRGRLSGASRTAGRPSGLRYDGRARGSGDRLRQGTRAVHVFWGD